MTTNATGTDIVEAAWQELLGSDRVSAELVAAAYALTAAGSDHTGPYYVEGPARMQKIGTADTAQEAVAMVVERLPSNCGPAFKGRPEELAEHERSQR